MTACPPKPCAFAYDSPTLRIVGTPFSPTTVAEKCEKAVIILTDDAGFQNVEDEGLGTWLSADDRVKSVTSAADLQAHFNPASSIYRDLQCVLGVTANAGGRGDNYIVGFIGEGETLTEALAQVMKCPVCAWQVVTTTYRKNADGTYNIYSGDAETFWDDPEYLDFQKAVAAMSDELYAPFATAEASLAFGSPFETESWAFQFAQAAGGHSTALASYGCDVLRDENFEPILDEEGNTQPINVYNNSALNSASLSASYATDSASYNWSKWNKPNNGQYGCETGRFLDETTGEEMDLDQQSIYNLMGINADGSKISGATRHNSAFVGVRNQGIRFYSGMLANGENFEDVYFKERYIKRTISEAWHSYINKLDAVELSDAQHTTFANLLALRLDDLAGQGIISTSSAYSSEEYWESQGYTNINVARNGYVVYLTPIENADQDGINNRNAWEAGVCFVINTPQHIGTIRLCETPPLTRVA